MTEHDPVVCLVHCSVHFPVEKRNIITQLSKLPLIELLLAGEWSSLYCPQSVCQQLDSLKLSLSGLLVAGYCAFDWVFA